MRILVLLLLLCPVIPATARSTVVRRETRDAYAVIAEVDRIAARTKLWPNFDPRRVPVEIYDGHATLLFRHPNPPTEFISLSSRQGVWTFPGRHETVTANAPVKLGGVWTATAMIEASSKLSLVKRAALVVHEMFHAHQRERHPKWEGNELELFTYPFDDAELLALRRIETEALRRAARAANARDAACHARLALETRRARFARLDNGATEYERKLELNEGLARYIEARASGLLRSDLTANEYAAEDLRLRGYATGHALALLLERFAPGWATRLEAGDARSLDELLADALSRPASSTRATSSAAASSSSCALPESFAASARTRARAETDALIGQRETLRREFAVQAGWRIVINAGANAPLWPQDFDPLNIKRLGGADVLHTRHLKLGNDAGAIDSFKPRMLTTGAGAHPLFNGVRVLIVAGLSAEPVAHDAEGKLMLAAEGVKAEFRGARLERAGQTYIIHLPEGRK